MLRLPVKILPQFVGAEPTMALPTSQYQHCLHFHILIVYLWRHHPCASQHHRTSISKARWPTTEAGHLHSETEFGLRWTIVPQFSKCLKENLNPKIIYLWNQNIRFLFSFLKKKRVYLIGANVVAYMDNLRNIIGSERKWRFWARKYTKTKNAQEKCITH